MRLVVDLTLPTETRLLAQTRRVFGGYLAAMGVDGDDVRDVVLAMTEACSNVLRHACLADEECFHLSAELTSDEVVVVVEDEGVGVRPGFVAPPPDPLAVSGRGLRLIRQLMTSVDVETAPARRGTKVCMRKSLRRADVGAGVNARG